MESDFYLKLSGDMSEVLRGNKDLTPAQPRFGKLICDGTNWKEIRPDQCKPSCGTIGGPNAKCSSDSCTAFDLDTYDCNHCCRDCN